MKKSIVLRCELKTQWCETTSRILKQEKRNIWYASTRRKLLNFELSNRFHPTNWLRLKIRDIRKSFHSQNVMIKCIFYDPKIKTCSRNDKTRKFEFYLFYVYLKFEVFLSRHNDYFMACSLHVSEGDCF